MSAVGSILSNDGALKALNSLRNSSNTTNKLETQLSSGKKINSPANNPAGYITAQGFTSQLNGINQATSNANQGVSLLQTAQGAINQQTSIVQKMNSIAVQAANGTQTPAEAQSLQNVIGQLNSQVNTIANQTQFNNINLLNGSFSGVDFQVGANNGQTIGLSIGNTQSSNLGMYASQEGAQVSHGSAGGLYGPNGARESTFTKGSTSGAFTTGSININGPSGSAKVSVGSSTESAQSIASAANKLTSQTGVIASSTNQATLNLTASSGGSYSFTLGTGSAGSPSNTVSISASSKSGVVTKINNNTSSNGISAKLNSSGNIVLTQSSGKNISITGATAGSSTTNITVDGSKTIGSAGGSASGTIQGKVQFRSTGSFTLGSNASNIGLATQTQSLYSSNSHSAHSQSVITNGSGAFGTGNFTINGSNGSASINVSSASESAATIANRINQQTDQTNVQAQANTVATFKTNSSNFNFTLGNGSSGSATNTVQISATSKSGLINAINNHSQTTGITAKEVNGNVQLTQGQGKNISFTNMAAGSLTSTAGSGTSINSGNPATVQGQVQLQSSKAFNVGPNGARIGLSSSSNLNSLNNIDVSTTSGAQKAINVVSFALQGLGAEGGKLGAVQQRLQANINNLHTTSQNLSSAKSVVQDANIPKVSQKLTQQQVLQQAGISALKNSTSLQKQYRRILP